MNIDITNRLIGKIRKLRILRHNVQALIQWPLFCIFLAWILWSGTLVELRNRKAAAEQKALMQASSLAKGYSEQLNHSVQQIDGIALSLKYYLQKAPAAVNLKEQWQRGLFPVSGDLHLTIVNRAGKPIHSTLDVFKDSPGIAHREYFQAHKNDPSLGLVISNPVLGTRTKKTVILFSRRLDAPDGSFDGLVVVAVRPAYLASFADEASLGKSDFQSVRKDNGVFLAAKMCDAVRSRQSIFREPPIFGSNNGVTRMGSEKFSDNRAHIVAWQKLANYPLVAMAGSSEEDALASYRQLEREYLLVARIGSVFLFFMAMIGICLSCRLSWRKYQAEKIRSAYRLATEGAREGFYIVRALHDQDGKAVDFVVEDCNEQGAMYYGATREQIVGTRLSDHPFVKKYLQQMIATLRHAMETGIYEDDIKVPADSPLQAVWMHRRLMHSGDRLAITLRDISELKAYEERLAHLKEQERTRISREIHDQLGGNLTAIKMALSRLVQHLPAGEAEQAQRAVYVDSLVDRTIEAAQRIATELRPGVLDLGIAAAIAWQAKEFEKQLGIPCEIVSHEEEIDLLSDHATWLFRIFQEALTNVGKHAGASRVTVRLEKTANSIELEVADNGRGIAATDRLKPKSFGIRNMMERAKAMGGRLEVGSVAGGGCTVTAWIPLSTR